MTTIPFCLIGAFGLLWLADSKISMTSLLGFLMLIGTVVNNGILYVDTVNQYRAEMDMETAIKEGGVAGIGLQIFSIAISLIFMLGGVLRFVIKR